MNKCTNFDSCTKCPNRKFCQRRKNFYDKETYLLLKKCSEDAGKLVASILKFADFDSISVQEQMDAKRNEELQRYPRYSRD